MAVFKLVDGGQWPALCGATSLVDKLHYLVKLHTDGTAVLAGDGEAALGVLYEEGVVGAQVTIQYLGVAKVIAAETIATGARVASDGDGKAVGAASGDYEVGTCVAGGDANEIISVALLPGRAS